MSSRRVKNTANKPKVVAISIAVSDAIARYPLDSFLTEKSRKAAKGFKRKRYATTGGRRMLKDELKASSALAR